MTDTLTFVLCIENNAIRAQALLLCESIRRFGGAHRSAPILAVAPRPGLGVDSEARRRLDAMGVEYAEEPLNRICPQYGSANRVFTAAWAEGRARSEWIVVLDSDTVFLEELELPAEADAAVRPVDTKGSATEDRATLSTSTGPGWPKSKASRSIVCRSSAPRIAVTVSAHPITEGSSWSGESEAS